MSLVRHQHQWEISYPVSPTREHKQDPPLELAWFCTAPVEPSAERTDALDARRFLAALRGRPLHGEARVPVGGRPRRLDRSNRDDALDWFGEMATSYLERRRIRPPLCFVPIPGPHLTLEARTPPWTSLLALAILHKLEGEAEVADVLRWKTPLEEKGSLRAGELYDRLSVIERPPAERGVLLVGYLTPAAALLQACAARLQDTGARVRHVLCAGRMVLEPPASPFTVVRAAIPAWALSRAGT